VVPDLPAGADLSAVIGADDVMRRPAAADRAQFG
jgi:hypothetical protein